MKDYFNKALKLTIPIGSLFFLIAFLSNLETLKEALLNGFVGFSVFGGICFLFAKSTFKHKVAFKWWQWIPYFVGALIGSLSGIFWLVMLGIHQAKDYGEPFFNSKFHSRTYKFGIIISIILIIVYLLIIFQII